MTETIRFTGQWPPLAVAILALAVAAAVVVWYARESRSLASPYHVLLPALRGAAVAMAILTLAGPVWHRRAVIGTLGRVIFAVDTSASMSLTDSSDDASDASRLQRASRLLAGDSTRAGWLESLARSHAVDVIAFDGEAARTVWTSRSSSETPTLGELSADGLTTDLAVPLRSILSDSDSRVPPAGGTPSGGLATGNADANEAAAEGPTESATSGYGERATRTAMVLMSDGRDTARSSASGVAAELSDGGVTVHAIGVGGDTEPPDVGVLDVTAPESVASDGRLAGEIIVKQQGRIGETLRVRIESSEQTVWQESVQVESDGRRPIPFTIPVAPILQRIREGSSERVRRNTVVMDLSAVVEPIAGDLTTDNDRFPFRVAATTRQRRLLVLEGSSRWELRYLRNLFDRDPRWEVDTILFGGGTDTRELVRGNEPGQFPSTREAMARYDAVIVGEVPPDQLGESESFRLEEFVTRGGGLILIDGHYDRLRVLAEGALGELVPVRYQSPETVSEVESLRPTPTGVGHPILNLAGPVDDLVSFWQQMPAPDSVAAVAAQPDAETWAEAVRADGREVPWLVTRLYGSGRVFYLGSGETWRWRYKVGDRFHARFWNQLLGAAMEPPYSASDDYVALGTDRIEYAPGEAAAVRVRLQDTAGRPVSDATVDALLIEEDRVVGTVPLRPDDPARGTYAGKTPPLESGHYQVGVRASGYDSSALRATTSIWVGARDSGEFAKVSVHVDALSALTEAGDGRFVHESSADTLLEEIRPLSTGTIVETDYAIWQSYWWFATITVMLSAEWLLRKRAGLV